MEGPKNVEWNAVDAGAADDVWVVGDKGNFRVRTAESVGDHWDGTAWTKMQVGGRSTRLFDVSVLPSGQAWAVGQTSSRYSQSPLIEYWDGTSWTPQVSAGTGGLVAVSAVSPTDVWAVGNSISQHPFVEHWDGGRWSLVPTPIDGDEDVLMASVDMRTADDGWAVAIRRGAVILHWDGTSWSQVQAPNSRGQVNALDVDAATAGDAWVVGWESSSNSALTQHWNGAKWSPVQGPGPGWLSLFSVSSLSPADTWAVGEDKTKVRHGAVTCRTLTAHWDGTQWDIVPSPNPTKETGDSLFSVATVSADDVWAVGATNACFADQGPLILHWNGKRWQVVQGQVKQPAR